MNNNFGLKIKGMGFCVPENIVKNDDFTSFIETSDEWISSRTGISNRHISNGTPVYLYGANASKLALEDANINSSEIDFIIATTVTNDFITPSLATLIANELNIKDIPCVDLNAACAGFVYAMDMAHKYINSGLYKNILVVSAENLSRITDFTNRATCVLFGDGAGACVVSQSNNKYVSLLGSKPEGFEKIMAKSHLSQNPFTNDNAYLIEKKYPHLVGNGLYMDGREVYKFATSIMPYAIEEVAKMAGFAVDDFDLIIPHQANIRIVQTSAKNLNLPMDKFFVNINEYGNTSSASIPICLAQAKLQGKLKENDKVCVVGFGAGLVYASAAFEY